jgi:hypothetical protein
MDKQRQNFQDKVWGILMTKHLAVYKIARKQETQLNALIAQGYDANWDAESIVIFILDSVVE